MDEIMLYKLLKLYIIMILLAIALRRIDVLARMALWGF